MQALKHSFEGGRERPCQRSEDISHRAADDKRNIAVNAANFRDVSEACELALKPGQIYRSSEVYGCDVVTNFKIKTILDLRGPDKCSSKPKGHVYEHLGICQPCNAHYEACGMEGPRVHHVDFIPMHVGLCIMAKMPMKIWWKVAKGACRREDPAKVMCPAVANPGIMGFQELYITLLDKSRENIAEALRLFVDPDNFPILVHCVHGKDRTGMIIMLILLLCGVPVEAILEDYARSETLLKESKAKNQLPMAEYLQRDDVIDAQRSNLEGALTHIDFRYGGISRYLKKIGITDFERKSIRRNLVQQTSV
ncbi:hypothetical protein BSKO_00586 [Bryopsis sp. KO-2023]|nr:hypothetical protein BSKO_00586 [Bryopsis sp. KO-2023]